jgi:hypothetical protein
MRCVRGAIFDVIVDIRDGVTDSTLSSGVFYASAANTITGPLVNQADIFPDLANPSFQDHAYGAIHRFHLKTCAEYLADWFPQPPGQHLVPGGLGPRVIGEGH